MISAVNSKENWLLICVQYNLQVFGLYLVRYSALYVLKRESCFFNLKKN